MVSYVIVVNDNGELKTIPEAGISEGFKRIVDDAIEEALDAQMGFKRDNTAETAGLVNALEYLTPHERTADASAVALTAGKMRTAIGVIRAALARTVELRAVSNSARTV